jgi:hydroxymethylglutaryl-CoA reductase (NADPH)
VKQNYPKIPLKMDFSKEGQMARLEYLENLTNTPLKYLKDGHLEGEELKGNIESFLGSVEIPVGLAGPLYMGRPDQEKSWVFAPIATNEGALVASMTRGAFALGLSGGVTAKAQKQRMLRAPMFHFEGMAQSENFIKWINCNFHNVKAQTQKYSNYADLIEIIPENFGKFVHLKFYYQTGDAAGQNMTTTCTWHACLWIEKHFNLTSEFNILDFVLEANGSSDKKVSANSALATRGTKVLAEANIKENVIRRVLKTTSDALFKLYTRAISMTRLDGMIGYNVNAANTVAAFFAATGQDLACIHESSTAVVQMEKTADGLYVSILFPSLVVGTIGGGTGLKGPREVLSVLGCLGQGKSAKLAEIIASFALGLEVSTMAAITSGDFALSHERLGRNRPVNYLKTHEFNSEFFNSHFLMKELVTEIHAHPALYPKNAIAMDLAKKVTEKVIGHFPFTLVQENANTLEIIIKSKPLDRELIQGIEVLAGLIDENLKEIFSKNKHLCPYVGGHETEAKIYRLLSDQFSDLIPGFFGELSDPNREIYLLCLENLNQKGLHISNAENFPNRFSSPIRTNVIESIAKIHGYYHAQFLKKKLPDLKLFSVEKHLPLSHALFDFGMSNFVAQPLAIKHREVLSSLKKSLPLLNELPLTLIHNDFNPRNIAIRKDGRACFYDWELARLSYPHKDLMEFILFTLPDDFKMTAVFELIEKHRLQFNQSSMTEQSKELWIAGCQFGLKELICTSLSYYYIGHQFSQTPFIERIYPLAFDLLEALHKEFQ